jgi:hypothetical protein
VTTRYNGSCAKLQVTPRADTQNWPTSTASATSASCGAMCPVNSLACSSSFDVSQSRSQWQYTSTAGTGGVSKDGGVRAEFLTGPTNPETVNCGIIMTPNQLITANGNVQASYNFNQLRNAGCSNNVPCSTTQRVSWF